MNVVEVMMMPLYDFMKLLLVFSYTDSGSAQEFSTVIQSISCHLVAILNFVWLF